MNSRNEYFLKLTINNKCLESVIIDQHYTVNHPDMDDNIILELVKMIDNGIFPIEDEKDGFEYFTVESVIHNKRPYRLVLLLCVGEDFLGVVNAFRVRRK